MQHPLAIVLLAGVGAAGLLAAANAAAGEQPASAAAGLQWLVKATQQHTALQAAALQVGTVMIKDNLQRIIIIVYLF